MRTASLTLLAVVLLTAGCLGSGNDATGTTTNPDPSTEETNTTGSADAPNTKNATPNTTRTSLYAFSGPVNGSAPPNPAGSGGLGSADPARTASFEVPANATNVSISTNVGRGSGPARVEVVGPEGSVVHASVTEYGVGVPCGPSATYQDDRTTTESDRIAAGTYEIRYYVAGSKCFDVSVSALLPS